MSTERTWRVAGTSAGALTGLRPIDLIDSLPRADDLSLERATLSLINIVGYGATSKSHSKGFIEATGVTLPTAEIRVLEYLSGRESVGTTALARDLTIDLAQASRQVARLAAAGFVVRESDPNDRRRALLRLAPEGERITDRWLVAWSRDWVRAAGSFPASDQDALAHWIDRVHRCLVASLPDKPNSAVGERWADLPGAADLTASHRALVRAIVSLVAWTGQSGGWGDLLESMGDGLTTHAWFTLRVVEQHGPASVNEVADHLGVDHTRASKRLTALVEAGLVDKAQDSFDRRSSLVRCTRRGAETVARMREAQLGSFRVVVGEVTTSDRVRWTPLVQRYLGRLFEVPAP